jgi:hypothetical protein
MIQRINPLHVVGLDNPASSSDELGSYTFSLAPLVPLKWAHGDIRGGTNAILIGDVYLSLFHSDSHINGNWLKTYWMGAYTFTGAELVSILVSYHKSDGLRHFSHTLS